MTLRQLSTSPRSADTKCAGTPVAAVMPSATDRPFASFRPRVTIPAAPASAKRLAIAAPSPCVEPVTTQIFPSILFMASCLHGVARRIHHAEELFVSYPRHLQRRAHLRILLGLDDEPALVAMGREPFHDRLEVQAAVAGHGEGTFHDRIEKAFLRPVEPVDNRCSHVLGVHVGNARAVL